MKKQIPNKVKIQPEKAITPPLRISYTILLLAYTLITIVTPNLYTLDSNGPKFLSLSILNLISFFFLLSRKELRTEPKLFWSFFMNKIGLVYTLFIGMILISFTKAINIPESILSFSKYFTVFSAAYILSILLRSDKRYFKLPVIVMALVLLTDSFTVFYNIILYITKEFRSIYEIKSIYDNKNILAAAIFVKIPFALWLASFEKGWLKKLGFITLFCAELAVFFMSTRAFYLGLIFLALVYGTYLVIMEKRYPSKPRFGMLASFFGLLILALAIYSFTQHFLFPKSNDLYNQSYTERLSSISSGETGRLDSWKRSAILFRQEPLLGVGTGNWKIRVLQYENPLKSDFTFMIKAHNDFIEVATETGIVGGLLFITLFVFLLFNFLKAFLKPGDKENSFSYLFLPAFGIFCYSFDAFFNYPADRAELQALFAFFIGAGVAFSPFSINKDKIKTVRWIKSLFTFTFISILLASSYVLLLNFNSLKLQVIVHHELLEGELKHPSHIFTEGFPSIPNVTSLLEPISVQKSRYLMNEGKYQEAIDLLLPDKSNPYMGEREIFLALAYSKIGNKQKFYEYAHKALVLKPHYFAMLGSICQTLEEEGKVEEAKKLLEQFTSYDKLSPDAWLSLLSIYKGKGDFQKAIQSIDTAVLYLPGDSSIIKQKQELNIYRGIIPYEQIFSTAMGYYNQQKFPEALKYLNDINNKDQAISIVYARRAYCYFNIKEYQKCINDVNNSITGGYDTPDLINIRGASYQMLGKIDAACKDFQSAAAKGNVDALNNEQRFCKGK